jgi:hypothetical protein
MRLRPLNWLSYASGCSVRRSLAQARPAPEENPQEGPRRAEALLDKARHLSEIRSTNTPPFRLKATFSFVGTDLETVQGSTRSGGFQGPSGGAKPQTENFPETAKHAAGLLQMFPGSSTKLNFASVVDHQDVSVPSDCAITKPGTWHERFAFGFEKTRGVLLETVCPELRGGNLFDNSCIYGRFEKFGDFWFPRRAQFLFLVQSMSLRRAPALTASRSPPCNSAAHQAGEPEPDWRLSPPGFLSRIRRQLGR